MSRMKTEVKASTPTITGIDYVIFSGILMNSGTLNVDLKILYGCLSNGDATD